MNIDKIVHIENALGNPPEKREWLDALVKNIENIREENKSVPFKIISVKEHGFIIKVSGLYGFISFAFMPWKYADMDYWKGICNQLVNLVFFCKIHKITNDPLSIIINGEIPQFRKIDLIIGERYNGIIIKKVDYGFFVDIGYHFSWKAGSFVGLLHKSQFESDLLINNKLLGDEIQLFYLGNNKINQLIFGIDRVEIDWYLGLPQKLIDKEVLVHVIKNKEGNKIEFLAEGKYKGKIIIRKKDYPTFYRTRIMQAKKKLSDGCMINCLVTGFNNKTKFLEFKWIIELDTTMNSPIIDKLDNRTLQKLNLAFGSLRENSKM